MKFWHDSGFKGAFYFSALWHLVWMSVVVVVVVPNRLDIGKFTNISFLGAYLDEVTLPHGQAQDDKPHMPLYDIQGVLDIKKIAIDLPQRKRPSGYYAAFRDISSPVTRVHDKKAEDGRRGPAVPGYLRAGNKELEGELSARAILYKPEISFLQKELASGEGRGASAKLSFGVSGEGEVKFINILSSSGSPDIDTAFTGYVRLWRFEPLPGDANKIESGTISLAF